MRIAKWCKDQGMTKEEYKNYKLEIKAKAVDVRESALNLHKRGTGIYYDTKEIIELGSQENYFIIDELKKIDFEFINNYKLYRII